MSSGKTIKKAVLVVAIAGYALLAFVAGMTPTSSKANTFPNANAPYQIPLDESPKEQALYLYEVLKEHDYSKLEIHLRRYVPELRKIDEEDIEPLDDIVTLALTATNPEVSEAFDLMIKGGRRGWGSFNTELQILFWLAEQNEFKKDDTLAQAIAMTHGLYVSIGTKEVKEAVRKDTKELLDFFRETSEWQKENFDYDLDKYPLETLVSLAWRGNRTMKSGIPWSKLSLTKYSGSSLPNVVYEKTTVSTATLRAMRKEAARLGWLSQDVNITASRMENYFFGWGSTEHWTFIEPPNNERDEQGYITTDNVDYQFNVNYLLGGRGHGDCGAETALVDSWLKSLGIATICTWRYVKKKGISVWGHREGSFASHEHVLYFDPESETWRATKLQYSSSWPGVFDSGPIQNWIFLPPVNQRAYLRYYSRETSSSIGKGNMLHVIDDIEVGKLRELYQMGIPTSDLKEWILYDR